MLMKKNHFLTCSKKIGFLLMGVAAFFFASCAQDGYDDDERFVLDTWNTKMVTPSADVITVTSNATGDKQTIEWPLVKGAGGFELKLEDVTDADAVKVIYEGLVDGCSKMVEREEDTKYRLTLRALGNKEYGNTDADNTTTKDFTTIIVSPFEPIPAGTDLYEYFTTNGFPTESETEEVCYDLIPEADYTLSQSIEIGNHKILLRSTSKTKNVNLTLASGAYFAITDGFRLRGFNIDMFQTDKALISGSETPNEAIKGATGTGDYYNITSPVTIQRCNIEGVSGNLVYDNSKKYCFKDLVIDNSNIHLTSSSTTNVSGNAIIYFKQGFVNDITVQKSTIWNVGGDSDAKYFIQYNNSGRCSRAGYTTNSITHTNCTFYNIAKAGQWFNCNGFNGQTSSTYYITNNIFVDCGNKQVARRILGSVKETNRRGATLFSDNTYWFNGENVSAESEYDTGYILTSDPAFVDAEGGNFVPTGAEQLDKQTGDPRWYEIY